ncbi:MAG: hypothetical protein ONB30_14155 [candidate division KSB1 bacterium]|nr:hypothetical protein [candidate division KSB1 bacterium]
MGNETLVFRTKKVGPVVWDRDWMITEDPGYTRPPDLTITLDLQENYSPDRGEGWDVTGPGNDPHLGRGTYIVEVVGRKGWFEIECYGTRQVLFGDWVVTYYANEDYFEPCSFDFFDGPEGLQPMPPPNFRCTNAGHDHENPHFCWHEPPVPAPKGFTYRYDVPRHRPSQA